MPNSSNLHRHKKSDSLYAHFSDVDEFDTELYPNLKFTNPLHFKLEKGQSIYIPKGGSKENLQKALSVITDR